MSFISFNLNYYKEKTEYYENKTLTKSDVYEAKQLLKLVDDLIDEGYSELYNTLQENCKIVDRLKSLIKLAGEVPFIATTTDKSFNNFKNNKIELTEYIDNLVLGAGTYNDYPANNFLTQIKNFANSIEYNKNNTYVFLLRDTLLPYLFFADKQRENIFPFLLSRGFLNLIYKDKNLDDIIRAVIIKALEIGYNDLQSYMRYCKKEILNVLTPFPEVTTIIKKLLSEIKSEKIVVVESGCYGTFPMLLAALDERIEFKMYTTVPYLFKIYKDNIFTTEYENMRLFETLYCQNNLFKLADFVDNKFYVTESDNKDIIAKSLKEINSFIYN